MTREMNKPECEHEFVQYNDGNIYCKKCGNYMGDFVDVYLSEYYQQKYGQKPKQRVLNPLIAEFFERCCNMERLK